jgi:methionyl-tRNA formyltransferase
VRCVCRYIIPEIILNIPKHGVINVHGSLLPKWRGASPIQAAIAAGDTMTGVTIMKMDVELDHGPIIATEEEDILPGDTGTSLHDRLAEKGARLLPDALSEYLNGDVRTKEQNHSLATTCHTLSRDDGRLDFTKTAVELERLVRAYNPWPGTWMDADGQRLKIISVQIGANDTKRNPGERFVHNHLPCLACSNGSSIELLEVQPAGKKIMSGKDFLTGHSWTKE